MFNYYNVITHHVGKWLTLVLCAVHVQHQLVNLLLFQHRHALERETGDWSSRRSGKHTAGNIASTFRISVHLVSTLN